MHILYTPEAEGDLSEIKKYISEQLNNPIAATNTISCITKQIRKLEEFPEMGARLSSIIDIETVYRFLVCNNYLVFYRIDGNSVNIINIIYGRRDYISILFREMRDDDAKNI